MQIQVDRAFIPANASCIRYLLVTVDAPAASANVERPPVSVSFVLDRSGSMDGEKIALARKAVAHAIKLLRPTDFFSVVCYDEQVSTVLERTAATKEAKALALKRLAGIDARGATDLHGGWIRGAQLAQPDNLGGEAIAKVILLTDGLANQGLIDAGQLVDTAAQMRRGSLLTSTFGVGSDFDEDLLAKIATAGGGHFYFVETPKQIPDYFASELGETLDVVLRDVRFEMSFGHGVQAGVINDFPCEQQPGSCRVLLGDMVAEQEITFGAGIVIPEGMPIDSTVEVVCGMVDAGQVLAPHLMTVGWHAVDAAKDLGQPINKEVIFAWASFLVERARRAALAANAAGNFEAAQQEIEGALAALRLFAKDDKRVMRLIDSLHHDALEFRDAIDPTIRKRRHFASYQATYSRDITGSAKRKRR